jgi:hypothetical protein
MFKISFECQFISKEQRSKHSISPTTYSNLGWYIFIRFSLLNVFGLKHSYITQLRYVIFLINKIYSTVTHISLKGEPFFLQISLEIKFVDWLIDWLIDWCLTPALAVFQLYRGVKSVYVCLDNWIVYIGVSTCMHILWT